MKLVYLVHGYPPYENAGTEQHCAQLAQGMKDRGHSVLVIAATRSIGRRHGEVIRETIAGYNICRIVNNIPSRPLSQAEKEDTIHQITATEIQAFQPDLVHIEHIQFLSSSLRFSVPSVLTLHDAWFWCPAGGTLLRNAMQVCRCPTVTDCLECTAKWRPIPTRTANYLSRVAGKLHPFIPSPQLHSLWKKLPASLRRRIATQELATSLESPTDLEKRNQALLDFANRSSLITAPSKFLSQEANAQGLNDVLHIAHGIEERRVHIGGSGFVFLGTMEVHKGPHIVEKAYMLAFPTQDIPIKFYGNGSLSVSLPHSPAISREEVFRALQQADCLVLGSIWPENSPMIILEARACGCPIIAPNIGGIPELIQDGVDGLLYPVADVNSLAEKMLQSLDIQFKSRPPPTQISSLDQYEELYLGLL